ncbi:vesicular, overexpressed in cancer, prosurvival protein 1 [Egretta garzetta]|uniref:vesicular, overexpressed in cancer, prosurvival protein 1 n=1 Tax=Egretta garzetta TaxID=188379 RepID=UPI00051EE2B6|nr:vesicular, overexpressed in cancer, prosurvival protein 1 [Egretta garzetta]
MSAGYAEIFCALYIEFELDIWFSFLSATIVLSCRLCSSSARNDFTDAKKHCWYFEGLYPTYYICRSYEDCCGSRCCVRALSIQRLWYFWFLLMMGVLFCCGAGFFIRRRMYPPPLVEEPTFNVSYTRQPVNTASGSQQPGVPYYTDPGGPVMNPMAMAFHVQPNSPQGNPVYPPPPSYCNTPPPPYEQVVKSST